MESTLLAYRENAGKREIGVLICGFRRWKLNDEEEEDDEEEEEPIFGLRFRRNFGNVLFGTQIASLDGSRGRRRRPKSRKTNEFFRDF